MPCVVAELTLEGDLGEEVALRRLIAFSLVTTEVQVAL